MKNKVYEIVDSVEKLEEAISRVRKAQRFLQPIHKNRLTRFSWLLQLLQTKQEYLLRRWLRRNRYGYC